MFTIYLITNKLNGKVYVGQTGRSIAERWLEHASYARRDKDFPLYRAMRKYGKENFICEEILQVEGKEKADYQERLWIILLRAHVSQDGYVCTWGGDGRIGPSPETRWKRRNSLRETLEKDPTRHSRYRSDIDTDELIRLYVEEGWTRKQIAEHFSCSPQLVETRTKKLGILVGQGRHKKGYKLASGAKTEKRMGPESPTFRRDLDTSYMAKMYVEEGKTLRQIGTLLGCSYVCVKNRLRKSGVMIRSSNNVVRNKV